MVGRSAWRAKNVEGKMAEAMIDYERQRTNMVESQVRPSDVTDRRVIRAMQQIAREAFVPSTLRALAYMDQDIALEPRDAHVTAGTGRRVLLAPRLLARMIQHLEIGDDETVLEVGTGTGYGAAVMSRIARKVVALESDAQLAAKAKALLAGIGASNVEVLTGPLPDGASTRAPFAAILVSGAVSRVPPALLDQMLDGGRLTVVEMAGGVGRLVQWRRSGSTFGSRPVMDAHAPVLPGFESESGFVF